MKSNDAVTIKTEEKGRKALTNLVRLTGMTQKALTADIFEKALHEYKQGKRKYVEMKSKSDERKKGKQTTIRTELRGREALNELAKLTDIKQFDLSEQIFLTELSDFNKSSPVMNLSNALFKLIKSEKAILESHADEQKKMYHQGKIDAFNEIMDIIK